MAILRPSAPVPDSRPVPPRPRRRRLAAGLPAVLGTLTSLAAADHPGTVARTGGGGHLWLLALGAGVVLLAVVWALFGPGARDE